MAEDEAGRLYDAHGADLFRYALMILASREGAEDVVQQVFASLIGAGVPGIEHEEAYLRRAVRNACYSALRHQRIRRGPPLDDALLEHAAASPAVSEEDRVALSRAVLKLPAEQREVIHLHVFEGRTFREIARLTGDSLNTIASRYRYALDRLRQAFASTDDE